MTIRLAPRTVIVLAAILAVIVAGIAYAAIVSREVAGTFVMGQVQTNEQTLLLYSQIDPNVGLTELNFGVGDIDAFGFLKTPPQGPLLGREWGKGALQADAQGDQRDGDPGRRQPDALGGG